MKLNPDCIRDILLTIEKYSTYENCTNYLEEQPFKELSSYSHDEIAYHIRQCEQANLIWDVHFYNGGSHIDIKDLTPAGHEFLSNIRENKIWKGVKEIAVLIGSNSLSSLTQIATAVVAQLIKAHFGIPI